MPQFELVIAAGDVENALVTDFLAGASIGSSSSRMMVKIHEWSFISDGPPHGMTLFLAPSAAPANVRRIPIVSVSAATMPVTPTPPVAADGPLNNISETCCCRWVLNDDSLGVLTPYQLRITTVGLDAAFTGIIRGTYSAEPVNP